MHERPVQGEKNFQGNFGRCRKSASPQTTTNDHGNSLQLDKNVTPAPHSMWMQHSKHGNLTQEKDIQKLQCVKKQKLESHFRFCMYILALMSLLSHLDKTECQYSVLQAVERAEHLDDRQFTWTINFEGVLHLANGLPIGWLVDCYRQPMTTQQNRQQTAACGPFECTISHVVYFGFHICPVSQNTVCQNVAFNIV